MKGVDIYWIAIWNILAKMKIRITIGQPIYGQANAWVQELCQGCRLDNEPISKKRLLASLAPDKPIRELQCYTTSITNFKNV